MNKKTNSVCKKVRLHSPRRWHQNEDMLVLVHIISDFRLSKRIHRSILGIKIRRRLLTYELRKNKRLRYS